MKKPKAVSYKRKSPFHYDVEKEQHVLRVQSGGQCQATAEYIHGRSGVARCPHRQGERCVEPKQGRVVLTVRFLGKAYDYTKAVAYCYSCGLAADKLYKKPGRKKAAKAAPEQTGIFDAAT